VWTRLPIWKSAIGEAGNLRDGRWLGVGAWPQHQTRGDFGPNHHQSPRLPDADPTAILTRFGKHNDQRTDLTKTHFA
jgi:hypothetical protein